MNSTVIAIARCGRGTSRSRDSVLISNLTTIDKYTVPVIPICPIGADAAHSLGKMIAVQRPRRLHGDTECTVARHAPIRFNLKSQLLLYIMESLAADLRIANR